MLHCMMAVSYTHLDVYKRQLTACVSAKAALKYPLEFSSGC